MKFAKVHSKVILTLILVQTFLYRLFSVIQHERILHEFDPYFNYQCTEYLVKHGIRKFWYFFDQGSWYPKGRNVGQTLYPGLMLTVYFVVRFLDYLGLKFELKDICVFLPPSVSIITVYVTYLFSFDIFKNDQCALITAFLIGSIPSHISRTTAGSFDNEAVALLLLVLCLYTWLKFVKSGQTKQYIIATISAWYMISSWGGYVYLLNIIASFTVACIILGIKAEETSLCFVMYHLSTTPFCYMLPIIGIRAFTSVEHITVHCCCFLALVYLMYCKYLIDKNLKTLAYYLSAPSVLALASVVAVINRRGSVMSLIHWILDKVSLMDRIWALVNPKSLKERNPLVASISEHHPTAWTGFLTDFWVTLFFIPIGLAYCLDGGDLDSARLLLSIYGVSASYFTSAMVRLNVVFAPVASMISGIAISKLLEKSKRPVKVIVLYILLLSFVFHNTWVASNVYSNTGVILNWKMSDGSRTSSDDFRNAYSWLRENTPPKSVVMAWWDYGYHIRQMANRWTLTDNNTSNIRQISTIAMIFASPEPVAYRWLQRLNVGYVLVVFGGVSGFLSDDVNKFAWMVRIAAKEYDHVHLLKYTTSKGITSEEGGNIHWQRSLLYKLCYFRTKEVVDIDKVRKTRVSNREIVLDYFEEVYTTANWIVRIYKLKKI